VIGEIMKVFGLSEQTIMQIDFDQRYDYGFDKNTGQLSLVKKIIDNKMDNIIVGFYDKNGNFIASKDGTVHSMSKGILNVIDTKIDLSKIGLSIPSGRQEEVIDMMKFLSFSVYKEMCAWGYNDNKGQAALEIAPWEKNTDKTAYLDEYSKPGAFKRKGERTFYIHTHPGTRTGQGGLGEPSFGNNEQGDMTNAEHVRLSNTAEFYILSREQGLIQYYPGRKQIEQHWSVPKTSLPVSLKKHIFSFKGLL
jgi:hypothetical protein